MTNIRKSIFVFLLPYLLPSLLTLLLEPPLFCSLPPLIRMLSRCSCRNSLYFSSGWLPCFLDPISLFRLMPSFWWFLFCSSCLWRARWKIKKERETMKIFILPPDLIIVLPQDLQVVDFHFQTMPSSCTSLCLLSSSLTVWLLTVSRH